MKRSLERDENIFIKSKRCELCTSKCTLKCSCNLIFYCSERCQRLDSKWHSHDTLYHADIKKEKLPKIEKETIIPDDVLKKIFSFLPNEYKFPLYFVSKQCRRNVKNGGYPSWGSFINYIYCVLSKQNDNVKLYSWAIKTIGLRNINNYSKRREFGGFIPICISFYGSCGTNILDIFYSIIKSNKNVSYHILMNTIFEDDNVYYEGKDLKVIPWIKKNIHPSQFMVNYVNLMESIIVHFCVTEFTMDLFHLIRVVDHLLSPNITIGIIMTLNDKIFDLKGDTLKPLKFNLSLEEKEIEISKIDYQKLESTDWKQKFIQYINNNIQELDNDIDNQAF